MALAARRPSWSAWSERFVGGRGGGCAARRRGRPGPRARQARHRDGPARHARCRPRRWRVAERIAAAGPALELAGAMTHFATADEDPEFIARAARPRSRRSCAELRERRPGDRRARRQQRRDAARARQPFRPRALRDRDLRLRPDERGSRRARARAGARAELVRGGGQAARAGDSAGYGRRFIAERRPGSRPSRSATPTGSAGR